MAEATKKHAVVTGANKGIGLEICRQLASKGIVVVLTARDEKRGLEAAQKLRDSGLSDYVVFHQLDVADDASVTFLAGFIKTQFGKLDILVNSAGVLGAKIDADALRACKHLFNGWAKGTLADAENLTEEKVDEILRQYLKDYKECSLEAKGWPLRGPYGLSKAAMNAYTRILAKKHPTFCINCVCPGFTKTDLNGNLGHLSVEEAAESPVRLALWPVGGPSGLFFYRKGESTF